MPTIKEKIRFNYDGVWSDSFNIMNLRTESGMFQESFVASRSIVETENKSGKNVFKTVTNSPLQFDMTLVFDGKYTDTIADNVVRWLFKDMYKPLYFEGAEGKVYYAMPTGESSIFHTGLKAGYIKLTMRCDSPFIYSPYILSTLETVVANKTITISTDGHFDILPEISINKNGDGDIMIESLDDGGSVFKLLGLKNKESIYLNCEKEIIETNMFTNRYNAVIGEFPRLLYGSNRIKVTGDCTIQFRYRNKYKF